MFVSAYSLMAMNSGPSQTWADEEMNVANPCGYADVEDIICALILPSELRLALFFLQAGKQLSMSTTPEYLNRLIDLQ